MKNKWLRGRLIEGSKSRKYYLNFEIRSKRHRGMQPQFYFFQINLESFATCNEYHYYHICSDRNQNTSYVHNSLYTSSVID